MTQFSLPARRGRAPGLSPRLMDSLLLIAAGAAMGLFWREAIGAGLAILRSVSSLG